MKTVRVHTELPTTADAVWQAMQHTASMLYVTHGLIGFPALAGRTAPIRAGERGTGWVLLFHLFPLYRHTIAVTAVDQATGTIRSHEHGGVLRTWDHTLHVEPAGERRCRYTDTVDIDAGPWTAAVAAAANGIFRYRQRRWHKLVRNHLLPTGPRYAAPVAAGQTSTARP